MGQLWKAKYFFAEANLSDQTWVTKFEKANYVFEEANFERLNVSLMDLTR